MTTVARITGDCRVTGNLQVDGTLPTYARTNLQQDNNAVYAVKMTDARTWDALATNLPGTPAADDLGLSGGTFGTNTPKIHTGDLKAAGATSRYARLLFQLPAEYVAGQTVTLRLSAGMETTVADTSAVADVECYLSDRETGKTGGDLCATAAQSINSLTFADKDFTITPTTLSPGSLLDFRLTLTVTDASSGTAVIGSIGAVEFLLDIKG